MEKTEINQGNQEMQQEGRHLTILTQIIFLTLMFLVFSQVVHIIFRWLLNVQPYFSYIGNTNIILIIVLTALCIFIGDLCLFRGESNYIVLEILLVCCLGIILFAVSRSVAHDCEKQDERQRFVKGITQSFDDIIECKLQQAEGYKLDSVDHYGTHTLAVLKDENVQCYFDFMNYAQHIEYMSAIQEECMNNLRLEISENGEEYTTWNQDKVWYISFLVKNTDINVILSSDISEEAVMHCYKNLSVCKTDYGFTKYANAIRYRKIDN